MAPRRNIGRGNRKRQILSTSRQLRGAAFTLEELECRTLMTVAPFTAGDLVVMRADDGGSVGINNDGAPAFLDEYTPSGTLVESIALPFNSTQSNLYPGSSDYSPAVGGAGSSNPNPFVISASAGPAGYLSLSPNGQYLSFAGYDASLPSTVSLKGSSDLREVATVNINGTLDDSTALNNLATANTPSAAFTLDGTNIIAGTSQLPVIDFVTQNDANPPTAGTEVFTASSGPNSIPSGGSFAYFDGVLYVDTGSGSAGEGGIYEITPAATDTAGLATGVPTTAGATATELSFNNVPLIAPAGTVTGSLNTSTTTAVAESPQLGDVFFATLDPQAHEGSGGQGATQPDTLYATNSKGSYVDVNGVMTADGGEVDKYVATSFNATTGAPTAWTFAGFVASSTLADGGATGLTGYSTGSSVVLYAQSGNSNQKSVTGSGSLFAYTDTSGASLTALNGGAVDSNGNIDYTLNASSYMTGFAPGNGTLTTTPGSYTSPVQLPTTASMTVIATHTNDEGFRGIAFVPSVAPTLTSPTAVALPSIAENVASNTNSGELVSTLISAAGGITDTTGDAQGIAITAADQTNGAWQFSTNGGATWTNFPASVSSGNAVTLASNSSTYVRFTPAANYNGSAQLTFSAWNQSEGTNGGTFDITSTGGGSPFSSNSTTATQTVTYVAQPPSFVRGADQSVVTNAGAISVTGWATNIQEGASHGAVSQVSQTLTFNVMNNNNSLFSSQPAISTNGTLTYTLASGASGVATVTVSLSDNDATGTGQNTSATQTFQIAVTPVGGVQPPTNSIPFAPLSMLENGAVATSLAFTGSNTVSFTDPNSDSATATDQIAIAVTGGTIVISTTGLTGSGSGTSSLSYTGSVSALNTALASLVFTPTADSTTAATIALTTTAVTTGGSASASDAINVNITPVNQPPSFTPGPTINANENSGSFSYSNWATNISPGPASQSGQAVSFSVSVPAAEQSLFSVQPAISASGTLTFTLAPNQLGTAALTITLTNSGGSSYTPVNATVVNIQAYDVAPTVTMPGPQRLVEGDSLVFSGAEYNQIGVNDLDAFTSKEQLTVSIPSGDGTLTLGPDNTGLAAATYVGNGTGTNGLTNANSIVVTGEISQLQAVLNGMTYTPPSSTFTGAVTLTVADDDLSSVTPGPLTTTGAVTINVVTAPTLVISQLMLNPATPVTNNQYIEIQGPANYTIPTGTYLIAVSGSQQSFNLENSSGTQTVVNTPAGTVYDTFNLSGVTTGSDGEIVILQDQNTYNDNTEATVAGYTYGEGGYGVIDPRATVLDNTFSSGVGFGNNLAVPGTSSVGHESIYRAGQDTNILKAGNGASVTYMLINSPTPSYDPTPGDELDEPLNTAPTGTLHGAEYASWNVMDSVGMTEPSLGTGPGDVSYGFINFEDDSDLHSTNYATPSSSTNIPVPFTAGFVGRVNSDTGSVASDWVASSGINGAQPFFALGNASNTEPTSDANLPLNNIGGPNFDNVPANVVTTSEGTTNTELQYDLGVGAVTLDSNVTVTNPFADVNGNTTTNPNGYNNNPNGYFLGSATVAITTNYSASTDVLGFTNTANITGKFTTETVGTTVEGVLTLTGYDTMADWDAALQSVTFDYTGAELADPTTRAITFSAPDGLVASNVATDLIQLNGAVANPPIVTGTSSSALTWTQAVPQTTPPPSVLLAPGLGISDASASQLTSATVQITSGEITAEDTLSYNASVAATDGITVSGTHKLTLTPTSGSSASLAAFQAVLDTVTYSNVSENPTATPRTITFTVVDSNSITSAITASSQQVINVVPVNIPPTTTNTSGADSYTTGSPSIFVDQGVTVTDPDNSALVGATVSITGGFQPGDTLSFNNDVGGLTGTYNATTGVLTLGGSGLTPTDYQVAMAAVTFSTTAGSGTRTISFQADDGATDPTVDGNISTKTVVVTGVSSSPIITTSSGTTSVTAGAAGAIDPNIALADSNASPSYTATVSITAGRQTGDTLALVTQNGISGSYNSGTGVLTISVSGTPTAAQMQAALASVTLDATTLGGTRTISYSVTDNSLASNVATKQVSVVAPATITGVYVSGSAWTSQFLTYLGSNSLGSATLGYELQTGASQLLTLPWINMDTISVQFSESVNVTSALLDASPIIGSSTSGYTTPSLSSATYNSTTHVATWTFASPLTDNKYLVVIPAADVTDANGASISGAFTNTTDVFGHDDAGLHAALGQRPLGRRLRLPLQCAAGRRRAGRNQHHRFQR